LSIIEGAAHAVNLERTAQYNALVLEFLRELAAPAGVARAGGA
jgi:pimeloyl-ACP methyl ester carboxylesterase